MFKAFVKIDVIEDKFFLCRVRLMMLLKINFLQACIVIHIFLEIIFFVAMCELMTYSFVVVDIVVTMICCLKFYCRFSS